MAHVKELHLGKCLEDLEPRYSLSLPDLKRKKIEMLLQSARKLYESAETYRLDGDEEWSYVLFMRYFNLIDCISKMPDYAKEKRRIHQMLGGNAVHKEAMNKLEVLNNSLKRRYALMEAHKIQKTINHSGNSHVHESNDDSSRNSSLDMEQRLLSVMTSEELFRNIQNKSASLLIMDCRPRSDFEKSHLFYTWCVNVPEEIVLPGLSAGKIQEQLQENAKALWSSRAIKDQVVIMDWNCKGPEPLLHTTIWRLRDILHNWDPDVTYRSPIKILVGGYEQFILQYPTFCTNPNVQAPSSIQNDTDLLDDIEYPSINDIAMKDEIAVDQLANSTAANRSRMLRPSVDRSSKLAALKTYDQRNVVDIYKEREMITEEAVANDKKLLEAENEWKSFVSQKESIAVKEPEGILRTREQMLIYNIMQLESRAGDYQLENDRLREELEEYKRREKESVTPVEAETIEKAKKKIESNVKQHKEIEERLEREKQEREKQLAIAREQKRHMKPPTVEEEEISKPKIPQFDRGNKPAILHVNNFEPEYIDEPIQRDFSPMPGHVGRGLTGLKNLGNTCYMNSILQCLSNTNPLTDYLITNQYKKHINRTNKTKGKVIEEVAALIKVLWNGHYKCVASRDLRCVVGKYQQIFRGIEQQDSHEFLTILMDWLHSDLQTLSIPDSPRDNLPASQKAWLEFTKARESLILRLFYGQIKSTVKCRECNKESATYECFSNLSLELPPNSNLCSLNDCMDMYFGGERIHGWICPACKQPREAVKKLDISKLPPVLVVHLKRFYADQDFAGHAYRKKQNYVRFPLENLDMTPYIARLELRSMVPKNYHLFAVSNHYGTMESGHYTAFCKSSVFGKWFKFDDQVVSPLDPSNVVSSAAYILFYTTLPQTSPPEII